MTNQEFAQDLMKSWHDEKANLPPEAEDEMWAKVRQLMQEPHAARFPDQLQISGEGDPNNPISPLQMAGLAFFGNSGHESARHLSNEHPDFTFTYGPDQKLLYRAKKAKPDTPWYPADQGQAPGASWLKPAYSTATVMPGMMAGGALGFASPMPGGALIGSAAGAGVTAGLGDQAKQYVARQLGWTEDNHPMESAKEAAIAAATAPLGTMIGNNPISRAAAESMGEAGLNAARNKLMGAVSEPLKHQIMGMEMPALLEAAGNTASQGGVLAPVAAAVPAAARATIGKAAGMFPETIETLQTLGRKAMGRNTIEGTLPMATEFGEKVLGKNGAVDAAEAAVGQNIANSIPPGGFDAATLLAEIQHRIFVLTTQKNRELSDSALRDTLNPQIQRLQALNAYLRPKVRADGTASADVYNEIKPLLTDLAAYGQHQGEAGQPIANSAGKALSNAGRDLKTMLAETAGQGNVDALKEWGTVAGAEHTLSNALTSQRPGMPAVIDPWVTADTLKGKMPGVVQDALSKITSPKQYVALAKDAAKVGASADYNAQANMYRRGAARAGAGTLRILDAINNLGGVSKSAGVGKLIQEQGLKESMLSPNQEHYSPEKVDQIMKQLKYLGVSQ